MRQGTVVNEIHAALLSGRWPNCSAQACGRGVSFLFVVHHTPRDNCRAFSARGPSLPWLYWPYWLYWEFFSISGRPQGAGRGRNSFRASPPGPRRGLETERGDEASALPYFGHDIAGPAR